MNIVLLISLLQVFAAPIFAFTPSRMVASTSSRKVGDATMLFDFFKPKKSASASHILVKRNDGPKFLTDLKGTMYY